MPVHPALAYLRSPEKGKVVSAAEAVRLIRDGDTVATGGFVGIGFAEEIAVALEERFLRGDRAETQGALLSRRHPKGWACLGLMEGAEYYVLIYGSPEGPRYTVCTLSGRTLQSDLPADDVYRAFPTVDVEGMRLEPAVLPTAPDGPALMLADPQD